MNTTHETARRRPLSAIRRQATPVQKNAIVREHGHEHEQRRPAMRAQAKHDAAARRATHRARRLELGLTSDQRVPAIAAVSVRVSHLQSRTTQ